MKRRIPALDWLRGIVMVLMAVDHASVSWNAGRLVTDSPFLYEPGMPLPPAQFFTRWITHLCAPTFLFLAGTSLALSVERRVRSGVAQPEIDRDMLVRGSIILILDPLFISWIWFPGQVFLQVLYAIGLSMMLMVPLRRLRTAWIVAIALALLVLGEVLAGASIALGGGTPTIIGALAVSGGFFGRLLVSYPVLPWLAMMLLGWALGRRLLVSGGERPPFRSSRRVLVYAGSAALLLFALVRGLNAYGNMTLLREDASWVQWLHVSKYPPSLAFSALELGLMALLLAWLFVVQDRVGQRVHPDNPLLVFGQTALFFYLLHIPLLEFSARAMGFWHRAGLGATYLAATLALVVLYPACRLYRRYKTAHPNAWLRFF